MFYTNIERVIWILVGETPLRSQAEDMMLRCQGDMFFQFTTQSYIYQENK